MWVCIVTCDRRRRIEAQLYKKERVHMRKLTSKSLVLKWYIIIWVYIYNISLGYISSISHFTLSNACSNNICTRNISLQKSFYRRINHTKPSLSLISRIVSVWSFSRSVWSEQYWYVYSWIYIAWILTIVKRGRLKSSCFQSKIRKKTHSNVVIVMIYRWSTYPYYQ